MTLQGSMRYLTLDNTLQLFRLAPVKIVRPSLNAHPQSRSTRWYSLLDNGGQGCRSHIPTIRLETPTGSALHSWE